MGTKENMSKHIAFLCCGRWKKETVAFVGLDLSCCELSLVCDRVSHFVLCRISREELVFVVVAQTAFGFLEARGFNTDLSIESCGARLSQIW